MLDQEMLVTLQWNNGNKSCYQKLGIEFTKMNDDFNVPIKMLPKSSKIKVSPICDYCGEEYSTEYGVYKRGHDIFPKDACIYCASKKTNEISLHKRAKQSIERARDICNLNGYILLSDESEYVSMQKSYVRFLCPKHGEQKMLFVNFLSGHKCIVCSYESRGENLKHNIADIKKYIESINNNTLLNEFDYINANTNNLKILCGCKKHIFTTTYSNYRTQNRCSFCTKAISNMEKAIYDFMLSMNIQFEFQKKFDDCKDSRLLPFDFYIPMYNLIIEFDGEHHFFPIYGDDSLRRTKLHDRIKDEYCKNKNINILRIPYYNANDYQILIMNKIGEISKRNSLIL